MLAFIFLVKQFKILNVDCLANSFIQLVMMAKLKMAKEQSSECKRKTLRRTKKKYFI